MSHLSRGGDRHPWTPATPKKQNMRCHILRALVTRFFMKRTQFHHNTNSLTSPTARYRAPRSFATRHGAAPALSNFAQRCLRYCPPMSALDDQHSCIESLEAIALSN